MYGGHEACVGAKRNSYMVLVGKPEGKRSERRLSQRWEDNMRMDLNEIGCDGIDWIDLAQDRDQWRALVNTLMTFQVP
jgi:hypothetical protein